MTTSPVIVRQQNKVMHAVPLRWRGAWISHWQFWLALAIGAFLRLWHLDMTQYLGDQVGELSIARLSVLHWALPITGIQYSILTYSPPLDIFFSIPLLLVSKDVFPVIISIALWNVVAIGVCYIFALRYFGRTVAAIASLLYATNNAAIHHSFFQWEPNYIPTFAGLLALALFAGCAADVRRWFVPAGIVFAIMLVLHQITLLLAPAFMLAFLLARHKPTRSQYLIVACACAMMLLPTMLFEVLSGFFDIRRLYHVALLPSHIDRQWLDAYAQALGATQLSGLSSGFGMAVPNASSAFSQLSRTHQFFEPAAIMLFVAGYIMLTLRVAFPAVITWRRTSGERGWERWHRFATAYIGHLREHSGQRAYLLLWVWVTLPPLALIRHSSPVQVHYVLDLYPALFVISALAVAWTFDWLRKRVSAVSARREALAGFARPVARVLLLVAVGLVVALQGISWATYSTALEQGEFRVDAGYGYPLGELQSADRTLASLQQRLGSPAVLISNSWDYEAPPIDNVLVSEEASRVGYTGDCLILPSPSSPGSLVVTTQSQSDAAQLITSSLPVSRIASIQMPGGDPFDVYALTSSLGPLPGEHVLGQPVFSDAGGARLRLDSWARDTTGKLRLRWTVLTSPPERTSPTGYRVVLHAYDDATTHAPLVTTSTCAPTRWQAGETLYTWTPLVPQAKSGSVGAAPTLSMSSAPTVQVQPYTASWWEPTIGPLKTETTRVVEQDFSPLVTQSAGSSAAGETYTLPAGAAAP